MRRICQKPGIHQNGQEKTNIFKFPRETLEEPEVSGRRPVGSSGSETVSLTRSSYLSLGDLVPQVLPEVSELCERLLDHVPVRLVGHFLQQQLPLVAELLHVNLLLVDVHLVQLLRMNRGDEDEGLISTYVWTISW